MANFDWRTDEEENVVTPRTHAVLRHSGRRIWLLAIVSTLVVLLASLINWRLNQRLESDTQQVEDDVFVGQQFAQYPVSAGFVEGVFASLLEDDLVVGL